MKNVQLKNNIINPWFITGFTDAEGCFYISISKNSKFKTGWKVVAYYEIHLHSNSIKILESIQKEFKGIGRIVKNGKNAYSFRVNILKDLLNVIVPHFDNYPLITQKYSDYILWKNIVNMMEKNEHLTWEGLESIVSMRASLNNGLSTELKESFTQIIPAERSFNVAPKILNDFWLVGFVAGEGCFSIRIGKYLNKDKFRAQLVFTVSQHTRDKELMVEIKNYFNCGNCRIQFNRNIIDYTCTNFNDNYNIIIPFFIKNPFLGVKYRDFEDWVKVANLIQCKKHLTQEGIKEIMNIKLSMNKNRSPL